LIKLTCLIGLVLAPILGEGNHEHGSNELIEENTTIIVTNQAIESLTNDVTVEFTSEELAK
jgi:hypothetical protein